MKQPIKGKGKIKRKKPTVIKGKPFAKRNHENQQYGTSQLERDFARDFLDAYGINYVYQYEAKEIGRYFDFAVTSDKRPFIKEEKDGILCIRQDDPQFDISFLIEIDGDYYHGNPLLVSEDKLTPMQKHNKFIDRLKDQYAGMHCIPLIRIWEYDVRHNQNKVLEELKKYIAIGEKKLKIKANKKKPH